MEIRHIKAFLSAARTENFRQTAQDNAITQPAVSQQIRAIEAEFGVVLFQKRGRGIEITEAGRALVETARHLQDAYEEMAQTAHMLRRNELGEIIIGYSTSLMSERRLPTILRQFSEAHPAIQITPNPMRVTDALTHLQERRIDVAIVRAPLLSLSPELMTAPFGRSRLMLAVPNGHSLVEDKVVDWEKLNGTTILTMRDPHGVGLREVTDRLLETYGVTPGKLNLVWDMSALVGLVASGGGLAILPEDIARSHRGVTALAIGSEKHFVDAMVVTRKSVSTAAVRHLVARLVQSKSTG